MTQLCHVLISGGGIVAKLQYRNKKRDKHNKQSDRELLKVVIIYCIVLLGGETIVCTRSCHLRYTVAF